GEPPRLLADARAEDSVMAGCVPVNAREHARNTDRPLDPKRSANWAARCLRAPYERVGHWVDAIRRWNGGAPGTANKLLCRVQAKLDVVSPGSNLLSGTGCGRNEIARVRRSGVTLLEMAEAQN